MNFKIKLMILIMLECRLSIAMTSKLFKISEEEIIKIVNEDNFAYIYTNGLKYLLYYETALVDEKRDKKAFFSAQYYLKRLNKILSNPNLEQRKIAYEEFMNKLIGKEILEFLKNEELLKLKEWTEERKHALLKVRLKYAMSIREFSKYCYIDLKYLIKWIKELPEGDFKQQQIMLNEYHLDKMYNAKI